MTTTLESKLIFWIEPSAKFTIEGAVHGRTPNAIEVHHFGTADAPTLIRTLVPTDDESAASIWARAIEAMLNFKRTLPFNPSQHQHGLFRFRYDGGLSLGEAKANDCYKNRRHQAVWAARYGNTPDVKAAGKAALLAMAEHAGTPLLEQALISMQVATLCGLMSLAELREQPVPGTQTQP